jgi:sugar phosphate isomerase/epimerase
MFENCPMEGWIPGKRIGSISYCPKTWRAILEMTPEMGINMDPSHLVWQDIDYERATREFGKNIVHAHGKDAKVLDRLYHEGTIGEDRANEGWGLGLYEHRIPGQGDVNWKKFTDALRETDYNGVLSVELEAPQYAPRPLGGNMPLVQLGMRTARENLAPFCKALD